jgi:hypothetical protein
MQAHFLTDQLILTRFACFYSIIFWFVGTVSEFFFRDLGKKGGVLTGLEQGVTAFTLDPTTFLNYGLTLS